MGSSRVAQSKLDSLLHSVREPVFWTGADRKLLGVNRAWEALTGLSHEAVLGLPCHSGGVELVDNNSAIVASFHVPQEAVDGKLVSTNALIRRLNSAGIWKRIDFTSLRHNDGDLAMILGVVRDTDDAEGNPFADSDRLRVELLKSREARQAFAGLELLVGKGDAHARLLQQISLAAKSTSSVLIVGEPGTGKRLVARTIHQESSSESASLFAMDCEALPADLLERTLFGPESLSREGGRRRRFNFPERSTLILENGLNLPRDLQKQVVQAEKPCPRWIVTTSSDPEAALAEDRIRSDFFHAATTLVIRLAPLRDRLHELPLLAQAFLERANARGSQSRIGLTGEAIETLRAYDWPGNLHELARVINAAVERAVGDRIERTDLPAAIQGEFASSYLPKVVIEPRLSLSLDKILEQVEHRLIENALRRCAGNKSRASEQLGISRPRLHRRIKELDIPDETDSTA